MTYTDAAAYDLGQPAQTSTRRMVVLLMWIVALYGAGVGFSGVTSTRIELFGYSFSARASIGYLIFAVVPMLILAIRNFPVAAGLFYAFLPMSEAGSVHRWLMGTADGAVTFEMALAVPLILAGMLGPKAERARRLPTGLVVGLCGIPLMGVISTVLAQNSGVAVYSLFGKILLPLLVSLVVYRRCRNVEDVRLIWWAAMVGFVFTTVFGYKQLVTGESATPYAGQRMIGANVVHGLCLLGMMGGALWYGFDLAKNRKTWGAMFLFMFAGFCSMMIWISATRGTLMALSLMVVVWIIAHLGSALKRPRLLLTLGGVALAIVSFVVTTQSITSQGGIGRAAIDWKMAIERISGGHMFESSSREYIWSVAISEWKKSPVWGIGVNNWVVVNSEFASAHSWVIGMLVDIGVLGLIAYMLVFVHSFLLSFKKRIVYLEDRDKAFVRGCRMSWIALLIANLVEVPITSGQAYLSVISYLVFLFPAVSMIAYTQLDQRPSEQPEEAFVPQTSEVDLREAVHS